MSLNNVIMAFAGTVVLVTVLLVKFDIVGDWLLWFTAFVGFNLLQSSFTGFCPLAMILKKFGLK